MAEQLIDETGAGAGRARPHTYRLESPWAKLVAGASIVHLDAIERLDFPVMILDLPDGAVRAANQAAADLIDVPVPGMVGRGITELLRSNGSDRVTLQALAQGAIDGYWTRGQMTTCAGAHKAIATTGRAVELDGHRMLVTILLSCAATARNQGRIAMFELGPFVVGTLDQDWRVEKASTDVIALLGLEKDDIIGHQLLADVHPDDVGVLTRAARDMGGNESIALKLRLRHSDGSWISVRGFLMRFTDDRPGFAFALLADRPRKDESSTDRWADLELRLRRIASELQAVGLVGDVDRLPSATDHPELNKLTSRQWDILIRLMRGERVPTIASELFLSPSTVRNYLATIFGLFDVHSQAELLALLRKRTPPIRSLD